MPFLSVDNFLCKSWYDNFMKNNKGFGLTTIVILIGLLVLSGFWYYKNQKKSENVQPQNVESTTQQTTEQKTETPVTQTAPKTTTTKPAPTTTSKTTTVTTATASNENINYGQAINLYASTRIQFNVSCQASPSSLNLKNGSKIMLDNRSETARTIAVDGVKFNLAGYGFKIVIVSSKTLPHVANIDCGSSKNNAQVNLQK